MTDADLVQWQARLAEHFADLRAASGARPLFALEHGLAASEIQMLSKAIRAHIAEGAPSREHPLPWVVYSAELGYRYSGDEYWQTFEDETPGWTAYGDRYWIRNCFRRFQKQFDGAQPSGAWAEHFSIICWPITHAILPRDLQRQLARILFDLRHSFSAELFESPSALGELIAARSWNATSRFQNFAQETVLVGQIAAALLLQGQFGAATLIHAATLKRIGEDLERERLAREWLRAARRSAHERARIRGLDRGLGLTSVTRRPEDARAEVVALGIEPSLVLRPTDAAGTSWEVSLEIPDLSHLFFKFPRTRQILAGTRCVVAGAAGRPLARGRCLHGAQRVVLARWPRSDEVLLKFDQADPLLEYLLRTECLIRPGPSWLFRIASDGMAYERRSMQVRPGERYIIVTADAPVATSEHVCPIDLKCGGVHGRLVSLPSAIGPDWEATLRRLGLGQAKMIEVWPAGLAAAVWDGEGHGEWLASERPCVAIRSDHSLDALVLSMAGTSNSSLEITSMKSGEPVFIELPQLPVGLHTLRVCARTHPEAQVEELGNLDVVMRIREARPWSPGVNAYGPLIVRVDPPAPTLEQLWEGQFDIEVHGPAGRNMGCRVSLFNKEGDVPTIVTQLPREPFPITAAGWKLHFAKYFRETRKAQDYYDSARICQLDFNGEELGAFTVRCERAFTPLRWAVRTKNRSPVVCLLDDTGESRAPTVARFSFDAPLVRENLQPRSEYDVSSAGGLYIANQAVFSASVVVMPEIRRLANLTCSPHIDAIDRSPEAVASALDVAALWRAGRPSGNFLSTTNQRIVLRAIVQHIMLIVGGERWAKAEHAAAEGQDPGLANLKRAVSRRQEELGIAAALALETSTLSEAPLITRVNRLAELAKSFRVVPTDAPTGSVTRDPIWLAELALRLSSDPGAVGPWSGKYRTLGITRLVEAPTITRAARFLVLATDRHLQSRTRPNELYAGWSW